MIRPSTAKRRRRGGRSRRPPRLGRHGRRRWLDDSRPWQRTNKRKRPDGRTELLARRPAADLHVPGPASSRYDVQGFEIARTRRARSRRRRIAGRLIHLVGFLSAPPTPRQEKSQKNLRETYLPFPPVGGIMKRRQIGDVADGPDSREGGERPYSGGRIRRPRRADRRHAAVQQENDRRRRDRFTTATYRQQIRRACAAAGIPRWHPHQLRHTAATAIRARYGVEAARAVLGHARVATTELYAERDRQMAIRVAGEMG